MKEGAAVGILVGIALGPDEGCDEGWLLGRADFWKVDKTTGLITMLAGTATAVDKDGLWKALAVFCKTLVN